MKVDSGNLKALKKWLEDNSHLPVNDLAQLAGVSAWTIRSWRRKVNIGPARNAYVRPPGNPAVKVTPVVDLPPDWRQNRDWLERMLHLHGVRQLARIIQRNPSTLYEILNKHNLKHSKTAREAIRSTNKCCTHQWVYHHYITLGYTQQKCSDLAGICVQTFRDWLNRFSIPVRCGYETRGGRSNRTRVKPLWLKILSANLRKQSVVKRAHVNRHGVFVRYRNQLWEMFSDNSPPCFVKRPHAHVKIDEASSRIKRVPKVYHEFGVDLEGQPYHPAHIAISRVNLKKSTIVEQHLAIQEFIRQVVTRGWVWPSFPELVLQEDLKLLKDMPVHKYATDEGFTLTNPHLRERPGRRIMLNFFDSSEFWEAMQKPRKVIRAAIRLQADSCPFNFYNLIKIFAKNSGHFHKEQLRIGQAGVWRAILRKLQIKSVLDIKCGMGNRAIAAAMEDIAYSTPDPAFEPARERGFVDWIGLREGDGLADAAIFDDNFRYKCPDMTQILPYLDRARSLLVFCPYQFSEELLKYKPRANVRIRARTSHLDYIYIW